MGTTLDLWGPEEIKSELLTSLDRWGVAWTNGKDLGLMGMSVD